MIDEELINSLFKPDECGFKKKFSLKLNAWKFNKEFIDEIPIISSNLIPAIPSSHHNNSTISINNLNNSELNSSFLTVLDSQELPERYIANTSDVACTRML